MPRSDATVFFSGSDPAFARMDGAAALASASSPSAPGGSNQIEVDITGANILGKGGNSSGGFTDISDVEGNIEAFGAVRNDISAATANRAAIQAAFNSDHQVYIPNGDFYFDATLFITQPKIIHWFGRGSTYSRVNYSRKDNPSRWFQFDIPHPGEAARLISTKVLQPALHIQSDQVFSYGGCIDVASAYNNGSGWSGTLDFGGIVQNDSICVIVDAQTGFTGGGLYNIALMGGGRNGNLYQNSLGSGGPQGLIYRFTGRPANARIINFKAEITACCMQHTYFSDPVTGTQLNSSSTIFTLVACSARSNYEQSSQNNYFWGHHQSTACMSPAERDTTASHYFSTPGNIAHQTPQVDFNGDGPSPLGWHNNAHGYELVAETFVEPRIGSAPFDKRIGQFRTGQINETHIHEFPDDSNAFWAPPGTDLDLQGADVLNPSHIVNTQHKEAGATVGVSGDTARVVLTASGSDPSDVWQYRDGTTFTG